MKSDATTSEPDNEPQRRLTRRDLLLGAAGGAAAVLLRQAVDLEAQTPASATSSPAQQGRTQGRVPSELGQRSPFEQLRRRVSRAAPSGESETPIQDLHGIITPADLHFERHHGGVPDIDPKTYSLLIHGMVERPLEFSLADLKRFPSVSRICFVECSGNGYRGYLPSQMKREATPGWIDGMVSTSEWTGVPLAALLREAGVTPRAKWFLAEGLDAVRMTRSIPLEKVFDDALVAYAQNGEAIRPEQGYPARLLLPGWEGNANVKWIGRIELSDQPFMTREETSKYTDPLANGKARMFSFVMDAKSIITFPAYPNRLAAGWHEITGLAWSGRGVIRRVEVSLDGGSTWHDADLQQPVLSKSTTRFRYLWKYGADEAVLMSRATDETGYVQPTRAQLVAARGAGTAYHMNSIRAWQVKRDGSVFFNVET